MTHLGTKKPQCSVLRLYGVCQKVLDFIRHWRTIEGMDEMLTVVETSFFIKHAEAIWSDQERVELVDWFAANSMAGELMRGTKGLRKVRYARAGMGKRGGARVVFCTQKGDSVWLLMAYKKAEREDLSIDFYRKLMEMSNGYFE